MANTDYLDSTPAVFSSISLNGSGATLTALAIVGSNLSTSGKVVVPAGTAIAPTVTFNSEQSLGLYRSAASRLALSYGQFTTGDGTAILPGIAFASEVSLGLYRSAASKVAVSYGQLIVQAGTAILPGVGMSSEVSLGLYRSAASVLAVSYGHLSSPGFISSTTTNQSPSTTKVTNQGQIVFSILSLTTNGAAMFYRSGNSTYVFESSGVIG